MDIHEYQAKQLLSKFGVNIPAGEVIYQPCWWSRNGRGHKKV